MKRKIMQIIPAPEGMEAIYASVGENGYTTATGVKVCCLALVETDDGSEVVPMIMCDDGYADFADRCGNFISTLYKN